MTKLNKVRTKKVIENYHYNKKRSKKIIEGLKLNKEFRGVNTFDGIVKGRLELINTKTECRSSNWMKND